MAGNNMVVIIGHANQLCNPAYLFLTENFLIFLCHNHIRLG